MMDAPQSPKPKTPNKKKRSRVHWSPTGGTPIRKLIIREKRYHNLWTEEQKSFLLCYVEERGKENVNWGKCADEIHATFNVKRTAKCCQTTYTRQSTLYAASSTSKTSAKTTSMVERDCELLTISTTTQENGNILMPSAATSTQQNDTEVFNTGSGVTQSVYNQIPHCERQANLLKNETVSSDRATKSAQQEDGAVFDSETATSTHQKYSELFQSEPETQSKDSQLLDSTTQWNDSELLDESAFIPDLSPIVSFSFFNNHSNSSNKLTDDDITTEVVDSGLGSYLENVTTPLPFRDRATELVESGSESNLENVATSLPKRDKKDIGIQCTLLSHETSTLNNLQRNPGMHSGAQTVISIGPRNAFAWGTIKKTSPEAATTDEEGASSESSPEVQRSVPQTTSFLRDLLTSGAPAMLSAATIPVVSSTVHANPQSSPQTLGRPLARSTPLRDKHTSPLSPPTSQNPQINHQACESVNSPTTTSSQPQKRHVAAPSVPKISHSSTQHNYAGLPRVRKAKKPVKRLRLVHSTIANTLVRDTHDQGRLCLVQAVHLKLLTETRDVQQIAKFVLSVPQLKGELMCQLSENIGDRPLSQGSKKHGNVSVLMKKDYESLSSFDFGEVVAEMRDLYPELLEILKNIMLPKAKRACPDALAEMVPRLSLVYGCIMQARNKDLSRIQRIVTACLADNICDQKVYDRLNKLGVSSSYTRALVVFKQIAEHHTDKLYEAVKKGRSIRLVGDNLNFQCGVKHETMSKHKHQVDMFASAVLVSDHNFLSKPSVPQIPIQELTTDHVILNKEEYKVIRQDCAKLVAEVAKKHLPQLLFLSDGLEPFSAGLAQETPAHETDVIPLPVLPYNESSYKDDVKILDHYEDVIQNLVDKTGCKIDTLQIGGDQLTRERFSFAKWLRLGNYDPNERFAHLGPVTFEFFHLAMNYLDKVIFDILWNKNGVVEVGTVRGEKERVSRKSIDKKVPQAYEAHRDFFQSYVTATIVEALMDFFQMESRSDVPTQNVPPTFASKDERSAWVESTLGHFVDKYCLPCWSGHQEEEIVCEEVQEVENYAVVPLSDGSMLKIPLQSTHVETMRQLKPDKVKDYSHYTLEVGLTFRYFLRLCKAPDRERLLSLLKIMMVQLKAKNPKAKYPLEILRLFVQQYSLLPLQQACKVFQAGFVNTRGKPDSHIPADLQMEWLVRINKSHIKHMYSNKTNTNIETRSSAVPGLHSIAENFDQTAGVVVRGKRHKPRDSDDDETRMMDDLHGVAPFKHQEGRKYQSFKRIPKSQKMNFNGYKFHEWFGDKKTTFVA